MRTSMRAAIRLALAGWLGLAGLSLVPAQGWAATPPDKILPESTIALLKINNAAALRESFRQSQFGQLWADPGMKAWRDDLSARLDDAGKSLKKRIGVTYQELLELPQGPACIAVIRRDDPELPFSVVILADAGKNTSKMNEVFTRATKQGEESGSKVATETFKGATLYVIQPPPDKEKKEPAKGKKDDRPEPPVVWTHQGSQFFLGSDVDAVKDLVAHADGRTDPVAGVESYVQAQKKLGSDAQVGWFIDVAKVLKMVVQGNPAAKGNPAQAQQAEALIQLTGLQGLKAAAGSFMLNAGNYDSVTKTIILAPGPAQGLLKMMTLPKVNLRPESWVPASVASYQTWSWDLDNAYTALNDLVNAIQPGMLQVMEQQLAGPNGQPLSFQKDIFGPLGDRFTLISDFKKPVTEDSQRMLLAVALEDSAAFQNTLNKLIAMSGGAPKKREFQGTTIYDFTLPDLPNNPGGGNANAPQFKGPISVAVAKNTVFVSREPTMLEQVLRGGGPGLADSAAFQAVAKEVPGNVSTFSYVRPEEQARLSYDMVKSGQFEKALQNAAVAGGPDFGDIGKMIDKDKLPDFSIFAKYLSQGGGYGVQEDDGLTFTSFTLRKMNP